jgi:hypothetical protein
MIGEGDEIPGSYLPGGQLPVHPDRGEAGEEISDVWGTGADHHPQAQAPQRRLLEQAGSLPYFPEEDSLMQGTWCHLWDRLSVE